MVKHHSNQASSDSARIFWQDFCRMTWSWFLFYYEDIWIWWYICTSHVYIKWIYMILYRFMDNICMLYIYALHFSLCKFRSSMWHVRQILVFLFHPKPTGPEVLNWKSSSRWYSRPIRSIDEPRIWAATFHAIHNMWSRLKSWLVKEGFSEGTGFICTFRISEVVV